MSINFTLGKSIHNKHEQNQQIDLSKLAAIIRKPAARVINEVNELYRLHIKALNELKLNASDKPFATFRNAYIKPIKENLPYFLPGGHCDFGHNNESLEFNGCIQGDIDFKQTNGNLNAIEAKQNLSGDPYIKLLSFSPSRFGVKFIIQTTLTDKEQYKQAEQQVYQYIYNTYGYQIDSLSASSPCFIPYDPEVYVNERAEVFTYQEVKQEKKVFKTTNTVAGTDKEQSLLDFIYNCSQQEVEWELWYKLAYALYNVFGEEKAQDFFDTISQKSAKYDSKKTRATFKLALKSRWRNQHKEKQAGWTTICEFAKVAGYEIKIEARAQENENEVRVNKYVSEIIQHDSRKYLFDSQLKLLMEAPTGGGKTTFAVEIAQVWHKIDYSITVIAVPTNAIAEQQARKYKCPYFTSASFEEAIYQLNAERERTAYVFANYDNAVKVVEFLQMAGRKVNLIIDEQHELINGYNYRSRVVSNLYKSTKDVNRAILMSATPFLIGFDGYRHLKVITTAVLPAKDIKVIKSKRAILHATLAEIKSDSSKSIVLLNDKDRIELLHQALMQNGIRSATIKNDGEVNNETYNYLMQHEVLPDDIDVLICTSKIATGVNIYAQEKTRMIYAEVVVIDNKPVFNKRLCQQFFARVRNTELAEYTAIVLDREGFEKKPINSEQFYYTAKASYERRAGELSDFRELPTEIIKSDFSEYIEMYIQDGDGRIIANELAIMYLVMSKEIRNGDIDELSKENKLFESVTDEDKQALALAAADFRQVQVKTEQEIYNLFTNDRQKLAGSIYRKTKDKKLKEYLTTEYNAKYWQHHTNIVLNSPQLIEAAEQAFNRDRRTAGLKVKEDDRHKLIFDGNKEILTTNSTFGRACNALSIHLALEGFHISEVDKRQVKQYKAIRKALLMAFEKQNYLSSEEIQKLVNKYFTVYKTKTKTTQIAEIFFELERKTVGENKVYHLKKSLNLERIAAFYNIEARHFCSIYNKKKTPKTGYNILPEESVVLSEVDCFVNPAILIESNEPCPF